MTILLPRQSRIQRKTAETQITVELYLDESGKTDAGNIQTSLPFLSHMLNTLRCHGQFGLAVDATGDIEVDPHHLIEDVGIVLGQTIRAACGGHYHGIVRAACFRYPMDRTLADVALDLCGRPNLVWQIPWLERLVGTLDPQLFSEFFKGLVDHAGLTLHVDVLRLDNDHHGIEAVFKAFARSLHAASRPLIDTSSILSTKGLL